MRLVCYALIVGILLVGSAAGAPASNDKQSVASSAQNPKEVYERHDFLPAMNACRLETTWSPRYSFPERELKHLSDGKLTIGEKRILGGYSLSSGATMYGQTPFLNVIAYAAEHGKFPDSVFELRPDLLKQENTDKFNSDKPEYKLFCCHSIVNPITGRIYDRINSPKWRPGYFFIERLRLDDYVRAFGDHKVQCAVEPQAWHIIVYGEEPGTVLQDFVQVFCNPKAIPWNGSYGKILK